MEIQVQGDNSAAFLQRGVCSCIFLMGLQVDLQIGVVFGFYWIPLSE